MARPRQKMRPNMCQRVEIDMYIHYYVSDIEPEYRYVCSFYRPFDPKLSKMKDWLLQTYEIQDIKNDAWQSLRYGELCFRQEQHATWFRLKWL